MHAPKASSTIHERKRVLIRCSSSTHTHGCWRTASASATGWTPSARINMAGGSSLPRAVRGQPGDAASSSRPYAGPGVGQVHAVAYDGDPTDVTGHSPHFCEIASRLLKAREAQPR